MIIKNNLKKQPNVVGRSQAGFHIRDWIQREHAQTRPRHETVSAFLSTFEGSGVYYLSIFTAELRKRMRGDYS